MARERQVTTSGRSQQSWYNLRAQRMANDRTSKNMERRHIRHAYILPMPPAILHEKRLLAGELAGPDSKSY